VLFEESLEALFDVYVGESVPFEEPGDPRELSLTFIHEHQQVGIVESEQQEILIIGSHLGFIVQLLQKLLTSYQLRNDLSVISMLLVHQTTYFILYLRNSGLNIDAPVNLLFVSLLVEAGVLVLNELLLQG